MKLPFLSSCLSSGVWKRHQLLEVAEKFPCIDRRRTALSPAHAVMSVKIAIMCWISRTPRTVSPQKTVEMRIRSSKVEQDPFRCC